MRCAFIGHPAEHTLSPAMHRAAYKALNLNWKYDFFDVLPDELEVVLNTFFKDPIWRGFSVSMPHKEALLNYGEASPLVQTLGVANTLIVGSDGPNQVFNTDVGGFSAALLAAGVEKAKSVAIIGNGGTAKSALYAVNQCYQPETVLVYARNLERAETMLQLGKILGLTVELKQLPSAEQRGKIQQVDLLISTIPSVGVDDIAEKLVARTGAVFDSVYDPWPTKLAQAAQEREITTISGLDLLVYQGVEQIGLMTNRQVEAQLLMDAAKAEISRRQKDR